MAATAEQEPAALLKNLVPLNALSEEHLGQLLSRAQFESLADKEYIFQEGDADHQHVYLLQGQVDLLSGGKPVDRIRSGSNTARFALAHQWPRKFSARSRGKVSLVRIDSRTISEMLVRTQTQSYRVSELASETGGDWMSQVLRSRLFQQIPASSIQNVLRRMESISLKEGEYVVHEGEAGEHYYVLIQGECVVTRVMGGQPRELAGLRPGDGFGEEALVADLPRNASVQMRTDGLLMRVNKEDFVELITRPLLNRLSFEQAHGLAENGAVWLDVRNPADFATAHLRKAVNLPMNVLRKEADNLDGDAEYLVYGRESNDGLVGAFLLRERGFDVKVLQGGVGAAPDQALIRASDELSQVAEAVSAPAPDDSRIELTDLSGLSESTKFDSLNSTVEVESVESNWSDGGELEQLRGSVEQLTNENVRLNQAVSIAEQDRDDLQTRLRVQRKELDSVIRERDRLKQQAEEAQRELDELQEVLQEASAEESNHQWALNRSAEEVRRLKADLAEEHRRNQLLHEEIEMLESRLEGLRESPDR